MKTSQIIKFSSIQEKTFVEKKSIRVRSTECGESPSRFDDEEKGAVSDAAGDDRDPPVPLHQSQHRQGELP